MAQQEPERSGPTPWNTRLAARRAALVGLAVVPLLLLMHPEEVRSYVWLYREQDWAGLIVTALSYLSGVAVGLSVVTAAACFIRNHPLGALRPKTGLGRISLATACAVGGFLVGGLIILTIFGGTVLVGAELGGLATVALAWAWLIWCFWPRKGNRKTRRQREFERIVAHLKVWRLLSMNRLDEARDAGVEADRLGPDPWPTMLANASRTLPGALTTAEWDAMFQGLCEGYYDMLPRAVAAAIDQRAPLSELLRVGLETGYVRLPNDGSAAAHLPS